MKESDIQWIDRRMKMPPEKPYRNIEIKYRDAADKEFTGRVSSYIIECVDFTYWREIE